MLDDPTSVPQGNGRSGLMVLAGIFYALGAILALFGVVSIVGGGMGSGLLAIWFALRALTSVLIASTFAIAAAPCTVGTSSAAAGASRRRSSDAAPAQREVRYFRKTLCENHFTD